MMTKAPARLPLLLIAAAILCVSGLFAPSLFAQDTGATGVGTGRGGGQGVATLGVGRGVRGTVTAVSSTEITVKTEQGESYKIETGANTRFRKGRDQAKIADIHVGDMVGAAGDLDDKAKTVGAVIVFIIDKEQYEKARADFGKTWVAGTVQAIDETKITLKRPDDVIQTIVVDENTSFRKHRDSITLADVKTGDNINARGTLQNGNFVASVLTVGGPGGGPGGGAGAGFGGRNRPAEGQTNPPPSSPATPAPPQ